MAATTKLRKSKGKKTQPMPRELRVEVGGQGWLYDFTGTTLHGPYFISEVNGDRAVVARHYVSNGHAQLGCFCDVSLDQLVLLNEPLPAIKGHFSTVGELLTVERRLQSYREPLQLPKVKEVSCILHVS